MKNPLLLILVFFAFAYSAEIKRFINALSTAGGNGTTNATSGANRAYASLSEWEAAEQTDLVLAGNTHVVECEGTLTTGVNISGWTTDATSFITVTVSSANRHKGTTGSGGCVIDFQAVLGDVITIAEHYTVVEWLEITNWKGGDGDYRSAVMLDQNGTPGPARFSTVRNMLIHDPSTSVSNTTGIEHFGESGNAESFVYNNMCYNFLYANGSRVYDFYTGFSDRNTTFWANNVAYNIKASATNNGLGFSQVTSARGHLLNCISIDCDTDFSGTQSASSNYNISSDATATGANSLTNKTAFVNFADTTQASLDLHLKPGADAIDTGTDLSGTFADDIDGVLRVVPWDIGADEFVSVASITENDKIYRNPLYKNRPYKNSAFKNTGMFGF